MVITVTDTGGGIADDVIERIFNSFFTTKPVGEGTGLGLAVAQNIVTEMKGSIEAANTGTDARFQITLPALEPDADMVDDWSGVGEPGSPLPAASSPVRVDRGDH